MRAHRTEEALRIVDAIGLDEALREIGVFDPATRMCEGCCQPSLVKKGEESRAGRLWCPKCGVSVKSHNPPASIRIRTPIHVLRAAFQYLPVYGIRRSSAMVGIDPHNLYCVFRHLRALHDRRQLAADAPVSGGASPVAESIDAVEQWARHREGEGVAA